MREFGYDEVGLQVFEANPRARRFYERTGFVLAGRVPAGEDDRFAEPVVRYRMALTPLP